MENTEVTIEDIKHGDVLEIKRMIEHSPAIVATNIMRELLQHIGSGIALKMVKKGKIVGIWCSLEFEEHTSLSYFYLDESVRKTVKALEFFVTAASKANKSKPVLIKAKDTTGFDRYVEKVGENLYLFKGVR